MKKHEGTGKYYSFHEKRNAWVIHRDIDRVSLTGGSWFESRRFKTEMELVCYLDSLDIRIDIVKGTV